jgi:hypothetical protein
MLARRTSRCQEREALRVVFAIVGCFSRLRDFLPRFSAYQNRKIKLHLLWLPFSGKSKEVYPWCTFEGHVRCSMQKTLSIQTP